MLNISTKREGFTIVELLIVIVVIGILATITIVAYNGVQQRARDSRRQNDARIIKQALESYHADNNGYPNCAGGTQAVGTKGAGTVASCLSLLVPNYLSVVPKDPVNTGIQTYQYAYGYKKTGAATYNGDNSDNYMLGMEMETSSGPRNSGWGLWQNYLTGSNN